MQEVQRLASAVVLRVLAGRSLDSEMAVLRRDHPGLSAQQRAAVQDLCFGTLRFLGHLDAVLEALLDKPLRDARLASLLRVALYQLEFTKAAQHAIVDQAVRACERLGPASAKGLVNAVLRNFLRRRPQLIAQARHSDVGRFSYPQWWVDKARRQYPRHYIAMLDAGNLRPPLTLRVNRRRTTMAGYLAQLEASGVAARAIGEAAVLLDQPRPVADIPGFAEGLVSVQDAAAQCAAPLLDLRPGLAVLDACAAPGGKTAHMLELADIDLTALDSDGARLARVRANLTRLKLTAHVVCGDACDPGSWWGGRTFDRILADVPCSASGVVRRHPDIKWLRRAADIAQFARTQARMLDALWQLLASGGKLLYATCSVFHEENQLQVDQFLERHRDARRLILPRVETNPQQPAGQILPDERHDGFFYALVQKN
ncbi:MAG: 16S rRNA (cytosine(967)-C(5))-methyltransferase RsmB [Betaproteobacteria bacterium]|nr:16S rRNA (cytosine(967)-C(5))-methyltransferase RsmB [Betaproteobacteria bacterium]